MREVAITISESEGSQAFCIHLMSILSLPQRFQTLCIYTISDFSCEVCIAMYVCIYMLISLIYAILSILLYFRVMRMKQW